VLKKHERIGKMDSVRRVRKDFGEAGCGAQSDEGYICTRVSGHDGLHVAHFGEGTPCDVWKGKPYPNGKNKILEVNISLKHREDMMTSNEVTPFWVEFRREETMSVYWATRPTLERLEEVLNNMRLRPKVSFQYDDVLKVEYKLE
jgi:hypothetical protein